MLTVGNPANLGIMIRCSICTVYVHRLPKMRPGLLQKGHKFRVYSNHSCAVFTSKFPHPEILGNSHISLCQYIIYSCLIHLYSHLFQNLFHHFCIVVDSLHPLITFFLVRLPFLLHLVKHHRNASDRKPHVANNVCYHTNNFFHFIPLSARINYNRDRTPHTPLKGLDGLPGPSLSCVLSLSYCIINCSILSTVSRTKFLQIPLCFPYTPTISTHKSGKNAADRQIRL